MSEGVCEGQKRALTGPPGLELQGAGRYRAGAKTEPSHCRTSLQLSILKTVKENLSLLRALTSLELLTLSLITFMMISISTPQKF